MRTRSLIAALTSRNIFARTLPSTVPFGASILGIQIHTSFCWTSTKAVTHRPTMSTATTTTTTTTTATKTSATDAVEAGSNSNSSSPPARNHPIAAVAQLRSTSDKFRNLVDIATCAGLAKSEGASMLFLPECFGFMGESAAQTLREAEDPARLEDAKAKAETHKGEIESETETENSPLARILATTIANASSRGGTNCDGASPSVCGDHEAEAVDVDVNVNVDANVNVDSLMDGLRIIARESGLWISGGGMHVAGAPPPPPTYDGDNGSGEGEDETPERVYNTHVVVDSDGRLRASYRKIHLFDVSIPGRVELRESRTTAPGTELVVCRDSPLGTLGVTTCYDLRFPETYTRLVTDSDMGARILLVPSAFTVPTGAAHWHALLRARAIENQCYVIAAAQYGKHNHKRESFGHSLIVDPWGKILADAGGYPTTEDEDTGRRHDPAAVPEPPSIVTAEIDLSLIDSIRERMPIDLHRSNATF